MGDAVHPVSIPCLTWILSPPVQSRRPFGFCSVQASGGDSRGVLLAAARCLYLHLSEMTAASSAADSSLAEFTTILPLRFERRAAWPCLSWEPCAWRRGGRGSHRVGRDLWH